MTSVIRQWMETRQPTKNTNTKILTRPQRRKTVIKCIALLTDVLEKEEEYRDLIPEQFNQRYETADHFCEKVAEAIECLEDAL